MSSCCTRKMGSSPCLELCNWDMTYLTCFIKIQFCMHKSFTNWIELKSVVTVHLRTELWCTQFGTAFLFWFMSPHVLSHHWLYPSCVLITLPCFQFAAWFVCAFKAFCEFVKRELYAQFKIQFCLAFLYSLNC